MLVTLHYNNLKCFFYRYDKRNDRALWRQLLGWNEDKTLKVAKIKPHFLPGKSSVWNKCRLSDRSDECLVIRVILCLIVLCCSFAATDVLTDCE